MGVDYKRERWLGTDEDRDSEPVFEQHDDAVLPAPDRRTRIISVLCLVGGLLWIAASLWALSSDLPANAAVLTGRLAAICSPLVLLGLIHLSATRTTGRNAADVASVMELLRIEQSRLDAALLQTTRQIGAERTSIGEHADQLLMIGDDAAHRLRQIAEGIRRDMQSLADDANTIGMATAQARQDFTVLMEGFPQARLELDALITSIETVGVSSHERAVALGSQVETLATRAGVVDDITTGSASRLFQQLGRIEGIASAASGAIASAAETMDAIGNAALGHAARTSDSVRDVVERQSEAMLAIVAQGEAALAATGADTGKALSDRVDAILERMAQLASQFEAQRRVSYEVVDRLGEGIGRIDDRFEAFSGRVIAQGSMLEDHLGRVAGQSEGLAASFDSKQSAAIGLIQHAETLLVALDAVSREVDETLPAAFCRLDAAAGTSLGIIEGVLPQVEQLADKAESTLGQLISVEAILPRQQEATAELARASKDELAKAQHSAEAWLAVVENATKRARDAAGEANTELTEAFYNVGKVASDAAQTTKEAFGAIAPTAAAQLSSALRATLINSIDAEVSARLSELGEVAERAVGAAGQASDRLMRQMLTIAETSAQVEARIAAVHSEAEEADRDDFSRRVAFLIESLNSTAIDVAKILSNDVSDAAWAAYLKGDRGVFARRAVRLLDSAQVREIAQHYGEDPEFREQVNRYIYDFEAMLRNVLATRNGSPLGVTLLSSDMGKLYVALAQAIERLR